MQKALGLARICVAVFVCSAVSAFGQGNAVSEGKLLFDTETFGGNGRTCRTCHSLTTGTLSPQDAKQLFKTHPNDPLFVADGSDDGQGRGSTSIQRDATILINVHMANNVKLSNGSDTMTVPRGIPTTLVARHKRYWSVLRDNFAKTLEDVMKHYADNFFFPFVILTPEDQADMIAFMKLLR